MTKIRAAVGSFHVITDESTDLSSQSLKKNIKNSTEMFFRCLVLSDHPFFCRLTNGFIVSALMMIIDQQWDKKKKNKNPHVKLRSSLWSFLSLSEAPPGELWRISSVEMVHSHSYEV